MSLFLPAALWSQTQLPVLNVPVNAPVSGLGAVGAQTAQPLPQQNLGSSPLPDFSLTVHQMAQTYRAAEAKLTAAADAVAAIPADQRTFANSIKPLHDAEAAYADALRPMTFMANVSPDPKVRRMADAIKEKSNRYSLGYADRDDIYQVYKDVAVKGEPLTGEDAKLLRDSLDAYKRSGMDLPMTERVNLKAIRRRLSELSQAFGKNLAEFDDGLDLTPEQLEGLPEDYIKSLPQNKDGKLRVGLDYPTYFPFLRQAKDPELRRQLYFKYNNRATDKNLPLLEESITLREKLAKMLGHRDYAHLSISENMAKTPEKVMAFLNRLKDMLVGPARAEEAALLALKRQDFPQAKRLEEWDYGYYAYKLRKQRYDFDPEEVRQYFPVDTVVKGTLDVYQELLGLKFQELPAQAWHPDIRLFEIKDAKDGRSIAYFYLDLHPRPHKYGHAAAFTILQGRGSPDGSYRKPVSAMVANFTKPTPDKPSLLTHAEVETFFHEFGHIMHQTLTQARYTNYSGTNVALDFVEAPSQMMENFVWRPEVLERLSGHYKDSSKKLPRELLNKMLAAKNFNGATNALHQAVLAAMDQAFHTLPAPVDTTAVMAKVYREFGLPAPPAGTHHQAGFGHLMHGYQAGYYSYLWSLVFAQDIFSRFAEAGVLSPEVGMEYRRKILERGSSVDEMQSMRDFLGREPDEKAFLEDLGLEPEKPSPALVDEGIEPAVAKDIKAVLTAHKDALLPLAGKVQIRFAKHRHPRNPVVLISGPNGFRTIFYLFEAQERLWKARFSWRKPWTWLPPRPVHPGDMDIAIQTWVVVQYAELTAKR